jgi:hypothetical protein
LARLGRIAGVAAAAGTADCQSKEPGGGALTGGWPLLPGAEVLGGGPRVALLRCALLVGGFLQSAVAAQVLLLHLWLLRWLLLEGAGALLLVVLLRALE